MSDLTFACPHCDQKLAVDESGAGMTVDCPHCKNPIVIPFAQDRLTEPATAAVESSETMLERGEGNVPIPTAIAMEQGTGIIKSGINDDAVNAESERGGEMWLFFLVLGFCEGRPGTRQWTEFEMEIMRHMQLDWTEDDLSKFRFRAFPVPEDWGDESEDRIIRALAATNLPRHFEEEKDWTWGRVVVAPDLGLVYPFMLVRRPLRPPVRLKFRKPKPDSSISTDAPIPRADVEAVLSEYSGLSSEQKKVTLGKLKRSAEMDSEFYKVVVDYLRGEVTLEMLDKIDILEAMRTSDDIWDAITNRYYSS